MNNMKTHVKTHLRRKKHGKAIVRYHKRRIAGKRMKIDISKKMPKVILKNIPGRAFIVSTPVHIKNNPDEYGEIGELRKEAKRQFRDEKSWDDMRAEEEARGIYPAFFESTEPTTIEYVVLGNKIPVKAKRIVI